MSFIKGIIHFLTGGDGKFDWADLIVINMVIWLNVHLYQVVGTGNKEFVESLFICLMAGAMGSKGLSLYNSYKRNGN